jgi:hypothetical protein
MQLDLFRLDGLRLIGKRILGFLLWILQLRH